MIHQSIQIVEDSWKALMKYGNPKSKSEFKRILNYALSTQWSGFYAGRVARTSKGVYYVIHRLEIDQNGKAVPIGVRVGLSGKIEGNEVHMPKEFILMQEGL